MSIEGKDLLPKVGALIDLCNRELETLERLRRVYRRRRDLIVEAEKVLRQGGTTAKAKSLLRYAAAISGDPSPAEAPAMRPNNRGAQNEEGNPPDGDA